MKSSPGTTAEKEVPAVSAPRDNVRFKTRFRRTGTEDIALSPPSGFAFTPENNLILADDFNHRIQIYNPDWQCVGQFGGKGKGPGEFHYPKGCAVDADGTIYVADSWNHRVQKFDREGRHLKTIGGCGDGKGQLNEPHDVRVDANGRLIVVERYNHRIQMFDADGVSLGWVGNRGTVLEEQLAGIYETPAHLFAPPGFEFPTAIAACEDGGWYIADSGNHRIVKFDAHWQRDFTFGERGSGPGQFQYPLSLTVAPNGLLYVTDLNNNRVQAFTASGGFLFEFNRCDPSQDLQAPNWALFSPEGRLWVSLTFDADVFEFEVPGATQAEMLAAQIEAQPANTTLRFHQARTQEAAGDSAAALKTYRQTATLMAKANPSPDEETSQQSLLRFSRLARSHPDPENAAALLTGVDAFLSMQQAARRELLETHLEWEQAALDFNRRLFEQQKQILAGAEDARTFDKALYVAEERDKTLYRKLRRLFFTYRVTAQRFAEFLQNTCGQVAPESRRQVLSAIEENWQSLCHSLLGLLETKETQEETMVQAFSALQNAGDKWERFLILANSNQRVLDVIRQLHFEMRAVLATLKAVAQAHPGDAPVGDTLRRCLVDPPAMENLQKILLGFQEDWNFHPPLETQINDSLDAWIRGFASAAEPVPRKVKSAELEPVPFNSEALDLAETARALLIEGMPLTVGTASVVCGLERISLPDAGEAKNELLRQVLRFFEEQAIYNEKHSGILQQLEQLYREKNRIDAQARSFNPQDKKAPVTQQHNLAVVNFQIGLLRRMALTLEINEARSHSRLIQSGALLLASGEEGGTANAEWIAALDDLQSKLETQTTQASETRKRQRLAISRIDGDLRSLDENQDVPDIDRSMQLRDALAEQQIAVETSEVRLNRFLKIRNRLRKLHDAIAAQKPRRPLELTLRLSCDKTGAQSGRPLAPYGLAPCPGGGWIAADYEFHQVCVFNADASLRLRFGGWGNAPGAFRYPIAVTTDSQGCIHVADEKNTRIQKFTAQGEFLLSYGDTGAPDEKLGPVFWLAADGQDRIWVPDPSRDRVRVFDSNGKPVRDIVSGEMQQPASVCFLGDGRYCIGDGSQDALKLFGPDGRLIQSLKKDAAGCGEIYALAFHPGHGLFAADYWGQRILHLDENLLLLSVFENGGRRRGEWGKVSGIAIIEDRLFVGDCDNHRIQAFDLKKTT